MKHTGYGLVLFPTSWALGVWRKPRKTIWSFGPLRLVQFRDLPRWHS